MHRRHVSVSGVLLALLLATPEAWGQPGNPPGPGPTAWHIVRPGETLEGIAQRFLGSSRLWPEIHRLNPGIADPNRIEPGSRIRMPAFRSALPAAQLSRLSRQVEDQPSPIGWGEAQLGDVLVERDGVRTRRKASAEMQFLDGARLVMTEDSLVFLRRSGSVLRGRAQVERKSIEIVEGQADLEARAASSSPPPEVEIVLGNTKATSRADRSGPAQTRARRSEEGGAKLMAYGGESEVEAGGAKVQVPRGMGTSVAPAGPPSPPEKLLSAPRLADPPSGAERACADPALSWEPVEGAVSYTVEVCRDPGCGELVERRTGETGTRWRPAALPVGDLLWRVTARSASGLDGYPSEAIRLAITSERVGLAPPTGSLQVTGSQVRVGDRLFVNAAARVETSGMDAAARWAPVIGGKEEAAWPASWTPGEHTAGAVALDGCGNRGTIAPVAFVVDAAAPTIRWEVGDPQTLADHLASDTEKDRRRLRGRRGEGRPAEDAWPSLAGVWQIPVPWVRNQDLARVAHFPVEIASDHPQAFFSAPKTALTVEGTPSSLGEGRVLWVAADDADGAGVDRLTFRTRNEQDRVVLEVEAADLVGNVSRKEIVLRKGT